MLHDGWYSKARHLPSPFYNERPVDAAIRLLVIHNISLPKGQYGLPYIEHLFTGCLDCSAHPSFMDLDGVEVSSHFLIDRQGAISQFVSTEHRAWHAGVSCFNGVENCNDYSIGIELEGCDEQGYTQAQYQALIHLSDDLLAHYAIGLDNIVGHSDIAPGRKTDPGPYFDWRYYKAALQAENFFNV